MVLPGLLSVLFVYHYMQKPVVVQVYQQSIMTGTTAKSLVSYILRLLIYSDNKLLHEMVYK